MWWAMCVLVNSLRTVHKVDPITKMFALQIHMAAWVWGHNLWQPWQRGTSDAGDFW